MNRVCSVIIFLAASLSVVEGSDLAGFTQCIGASGAGPTCILDAKVWQVNSTLLIGRSNIVIEGTVGNPSDAVLQRSPSLGQNDIMSIAPGLANAVVTVKYLTFDGNRQAVDLCSTSNLSIADLDLWNAGLATVQNVDFIDAPWTSLNLGGSLGSSTQASTVSYSSFGQGFSAQGISRTAQQSASRWEGVKVQGPYTGVWSNNIAYTGLVAVELWKGSYQYVVDNVVNVGKYEEPDGVPGGVIYIPGTNPVSYASIADNVLNGNYWDTTNAQDTNPSAPNYTLCLPSPRLWSFGIETSGNGHRYFNNSVIQNLGFGILLRPWDSNSSLNDNVISGWDPFCTGSCQFVPHYVENNGGCWTLYGCYGSGWPSAYRMSGISVITQGAGGSGTGTVSNLTLDHVRSVVNSRYGVSLDGVTGGPGFIDSVNGYDYACIENNGSTNLVSTNSATPYNSYTNSCP